MQEKDKSMMKAMIDDEMAYFFGFYRGSYGEVLGELARTKVGSFRTSSIPLTEFWQPANLNDISNLLAPYLPGFNPEVALKFFEFPTDPLVNGKRVGRPSMTDVMILDADWQIAIEGKFTEYLANEDKTVNSWLQEAETVNDLTLRRKILKSWVQYINCARCTDIESIGVFYRDCKQLSYQFLHRTASACFKANGTEGRTPVLVYQLFFDRGDAAHVAAMEVFKANLRRWADALRLRNMKFLVLSVPVTNFADVQRRFDGQHGEIFHSMRGETIYRFDFGAIEVETVIDEKMPNGKEDR